MELSKLMIELKQIQVKCPFDQGNLKFILKQYKQGLTSQISKQQSKRQIILKNNKAIINQIFSFQNMKDTKIVIIIMISKIKEISLLGIVNLELKKFETKQLPHHFSQFLQKASDPKASIELCLRRTLTEGSSNNSSNKTIKKSDFILKQQLKQNNLNNNITNHILPTQYQMQKRIKISKDNQNTYRQKITEISHKNYKNIQILRDDKKKQNSRQKSERSNSSSYKKRFEYNQKINTTNNITQKNLEKKNDKDVPVARQKTPEPIKFESQNKKNIINTTKAKTKEGSFSIGKQQKLNSKALEQKNTKLKKFTNKLEQIQSQIVQKKEKLIKQTPQHMYNSTGSQQARQLKIKPYQLQTNCNSEIKMIQKADNQNEKIRWESILRQKDNKIKQLEQQKCYNEKLTDKLTKLYENSEQNCIKYQNQLKCIVQILQKQRKQKQQLSFEIQQLNQQNSKYKIQIQQLLKNKQKYDDSEQKLQKTLQILENNLKLSKLNQSSLRSQKNNLQFKIKTLQQSNIESEQSNNNKNSIYNQNQLLRQQIKLLQKHNQELLNQISFLTKNNKVSSLLLDQKNQIIKLKQQNESLLKQIYELETQVSVSKIKFAELMNTALEKEGIQRVNFLESKIANKKIQNFK